MSTFNQLVLKALGCPTIMPPKLPGDWLVCGRASGGWDACETKFLTLGANFRQTTKRFEFRTFTEVFGRPVEIAVTWKFKGGYFFWVRVWVFRIWNMGSLAESSSWLKPKPGMQTSQKSVQKLVKNEEMISECAIWIVQESIAACFRCYTKYDS